MQHLPQVHVSCRALASPVAGWSPGSAHPELKRSRRRSRAAQLLSVLLVCSAWACSDSPAGVAAVARVEIEPAAVTLAPTESRQLQARVRDARGNALVGRAVQWLSAAAGVASVGGTGLVLGVAPGTAQIRAVSEGVEGTADISVTTPPVTLQSINPTGASLGESLVVAITGTGFLDGITTAAFGSGITVNAASVPNATSLVANVTVAADAGAGLRNVTVTNPAPGGGSAILTDAFRVIGTVSATLSDVTASPASAIAANGTATANVIAVLRDAAGGALPGLTPDAFTVTVSGSARSGMVSATDTPGEYGFAVTDTVAETIIVSVQVSGVTLTQMPTVQFVAGPAARLDIVTQPSASAASGSALAQQPVVRLLDVMGNAVPHADVIITAAIATGGGTLGGAATSATNASGVASYTNLSISGTVGTRTLAFAAAGLSPDTSTTISLTAGAPAQIAAYAGTGQSARVGTTVPVAPAVTVTDAAGNGVANFIVAFAVTSGGGALAATGDVATNTAGLASAPAWTLGPLPGENTLAATAHGLAGSPVTFTATGTPAPPVRIVTFGDSNTDFAYDDAPGTALLARSYVSSGINGRLAPSAPHHANHLAGLVEARWSEQESAVITAVNHGISGTSSGGGAGGGADRHPASSPNARAVVNGITRYEAEVLGLGYPWHGGEADATHFPDGPITRVQSFTPGENDFAYVSMGTNDVAYTISAEQTIANLTWMVDAWLGAGRDADRFIITTLAPRSGSSGIIFPQINSGIRTLAAARGIQLIDLAAHTSDDDGVTWRSADLHVGDSLHYTTTVRAWIADRIVAHMRSIAGAAVAASVGR